jgi:hypothetical protein
MKYLVSIFNRGPSVFGNTYVITSSKKRLAQLRDEHKEVWIYPIGPNGVVTHPLDLAEITNLIGEKPRCQLMPSL